MTPPTPKIGSPVLLSPPGSAPTAALNQLVPPLTPREIAPPFFAITSDEVFETGNAAMAILPRTPTRLAKTLFSDRLETTEQGIPDAIGLLITNYRKMFSPRAIGVLAALPRSSHQVQASVSSVSHHLLRYMADNVKFAHHLRPLLKGLRELGLCLTTTAPSPQRESVMSLAEMDQRPGLALPPEALSQKTELTSARSLKDVSFYSEDDWVRTFRYWSGQPLALRELLQPVFYTPDQTLKSPAALNAAWKFLALVLDPDELCLAFDTLNSSKDVTKILTAVYDETYSVQEPLLCITLFTTLSQYQRLGLVLASLLEEEFFREAGISLLVESQIYLSLEKAFIFGQCYEAIAATHPGWFPTFGEVLTRYAIVPDDQPTCWLSDPASAHDRYLLAMAKLGDDSTRLSGLNELAEVAARPDASLELRERVAFVLLNQWRDCDENPMAWHEKGDKPDLRKICEKGLKAVQERVFHDELSEAIDFALGANTRQTVSIQIMALSKNKEGLRNLIASNDPCQIEALMAYAKLWNDWSDLDLSFIKDWTRFDTSSIKGRELSVSPVPFCLLPNKIIAKCKITMAIDAARPDDDWLVHLQKAPTRFWLVIKTPTLTPDLFLCTLDPAIDYQEVNTLDGRWDQQTIVDLMNKEFGPAPKRSKKTWNEVAGWHMPDPVTQVSFKTWLDTYSQQPTIDDDDFCSAIEWLRDKHGRTLAQLDPDRQLRWHLWQLAMHDDDHVPESLLAIQHLSAMQGLSSQHMQRLVDTLSNGIKATSGPKGLYFETLCRFNGDVVNQAWMAIGTDSGHSFDLRLDALQELTERYQKNLLTGVAPEDVRATMKEMAISDNEHSKNLLFLLSIMQPDKQAFVNDLLDIATDTLEAKTLQACIEKIEIISKTHAMPTADASDLAFIKMRLKMMAILDSVARLSPMAIDDLGLLEKTKNPYQAFALPAALTGTTTQDMILKHLELMRAFVNKSDYPFVRQYAQHPDALTDLVMIMIRTGKSAQEVAYFVAEIDQQIKVSLKGKPMAYDEQTGSNASDVLLRLAETGLLAGISPAEIVAKMLALHGRHKKHRDPRQKNSLSAEDKILHYILAGPKTITDNFDVVAAMNPAEVQWPFKMLLALKQLRQKIESFEAFETVDKEVFDSEFFQYDLVLVATLARKPIGNVLQLAREICEKTSAFFDLSLNLLKRMVQDMTLTAVLTGLSAQQIVKLATDTIQIMTLQKKTFFLSPDNDKIWESCRHVLFGAALSVAGFRPVFSPMRSHPDVKGCFEFQPQWLFLTTSMYPKPRLEPKIL